MTRMYLPRWKRATQFMYEVVIVVCVQTLNLCTEDALLFTCSDKPHRTPFEVVGITVLQYR